MSGEKHNGREIIDRSVKRLVESGMRVDVAEKKAREARIRNEKREKDGGR